MSKRLLSHNLTPICFLKDFSYRINSKRCVGLYRKRRRTLYYLLLKVTFGFIIGVEIKYCEFHDVLCVVGMSSLPDDCELAPVLAWHVTLLVL